MCLVQKLDPFSMGCHQIYVNMPQKLQILIPSKISFNYQIKCEIWHATITFSAEYSSIIKKLNWLAIRLSIHAKVTAKFCCDKFVPYFGGQLLNGSKRSKGHDILQMNLTSTILIYNELANLLYTQVQRCST